MGNTVKARLVHSILWMRLVRLETMSVSGERRTGRFLGAHAGPREDPGIELSLEESEWDSESGRK